MKTILRAVAAVLALSAMAQQSASAATDTHGAITYAFGVVYGIGWGFMYRTPSGWTAATCGSAMHDTVITLWPKDSPSSQPETVMYVTAALRDKINFSTFVRDEITRYKANDPVTAKTVYSNQTIVSPTRRLIHIAHSAGNRDELVEYIEGRRAYFIVVLTSESPAATARYRPAFNAFLNSFTPASIKCSGNVCASLKRPGHENCAASIAAR